MFPQDRPGEVKVISIGHQGGVSNYIVVGIRFFWVGSGDGYGWIILVLSHWFTWSNCLLV